MSLFDPDIILPAEVIFNPFWWNRNCGIGFDKEFFFNAYCRVDSELRMRKYLYDRFGDIGLGEKDEKERPIIGPIHLAAGFIVSHILGCEIRFNESSPPDVITANMGDAEIMKMEAPIFEKVPVIKELINMMDILENKYGYLEGDIDWSGVLNIALDLRGQQLFIDFYENRKLAKHLFDVISKTIIEFVTFIRNRTGTSSISVNPFVKHFKPSINLHSNCSITMISLNMYEDLLLEYDGHLSLYLQPYGIHHCGSDMERLAPGYAKVVGAHYFDVGWGSDISKCRRYLPNAFLNLRLSPVKMLVCNAEDVRRDICRLVDENNGIEKAGICCINIDYGTPDENIREIFNVANDLRKGCAT